MSFWHSLSLGGSEENFLRIGPGCAASEVGTMSNILPKGNKASGLIVRKFSIGF
jgi:hypothetical protein